MPSILRRGGAARRWWAALAGGALAGGVLLHPVVMGVHRAARPAEPRARGVLPWLPGSAAEWTLYAALGSGLAALVLWSQGKQSRQTRPPPPASRRMLASIIAGGEREDVEFKASARWDLREQRSNKALELAAARTIAAFLNSRGGTLLIGVSDDGQILGVAADYQTLRRRNADGYTQFLMGLIESRLGGSACSLVHVRFEDVAGTEICRVDVEASARPVYLHDGDVAHYFVRAGNSTRELDVQEALTHIASRRASPS